MFDAMSFGKFVEDLLTYQKAPFDKFCDLQFSHKLRNHEMNSSGPLYISCMCWEVKIDMRGQSNNCFQFATNWPSALG